MDDIDFLRTKLRLMSPYLKPVMADGMTTIVENLAHNAAVIDRKAAVLLDQEFDRMIRDVVYDDGRLTIYEPLRSQFGRARLGKSVDSILKGVLRRGHIVDGDEAMVVRDFISGDDLPGFGDKRRRKLDELFHAFELALPKRSEVDTSAQHVDR